jgi:hypothetical protein
MTLETMWYRGYIEIGKQFMVKRVDEDEIFSGMLIMNDLHEESEIYLVDLEFGYIECNIDDFNYYEVLFIQ